MSDDICKHGWSRRFCEQCSQARIIASLKGPGDKGMLANPPDDLVERVAREICCPPHLGHCCPEECSVHHFLPTARAAIAVCMQEAAEVAENASFHFTQTTPSTVEVVDVRHTIAAAIRALVKHD